MALDLYRPVDLIGAPDPAFIHPDDVDMEVELPPEDPTEEARKKKIVEEGLDRFAISAEAYGPQVERELDDLSFEAGDQWLAEHKDARAGGVGPDGVVTPSRPCLTINKLDQPIQQVLNEARMARLAIEIKPRGNKATKETAEVRQGLIRAIEVDSRAQIARLWALDRAVKCGRGGYRIQKAYANDGDMDMDLIVSRILNQHSIYPDPHAQEPDWSDGEFLLLTSDFTENEFRRRWPKARLSLASSDELIALGDAQPVWVHGENNKRTFRVAEYFYVVYRERLLVDLGDGGPAVWMDDFGPEQAALIQGLLLQQPDTFATRVVQQRSVKWAVITASDVLDEEDWEGRYIPVVPVIGKEYNVNGKRFWKGIVSNAKDAQRSYNVMRSEQMAAIGAGSKATWVLAEGQDENYEQMWDNVNTRYYTRVIYKPTTFDGHLVPPPHRDVAEPPIQAITLAVREADNDIKATTGRFDPSLGRQSSDRSGRAIRELKVQGETGTSNYLDNLATIAMTLEGKILNDMITHVYNRPGRVVRTLGEENEEREVMLNQPYQPSPDGPQALPPGVPFDPTQHKKYDLSVGEHRIIVGVGPAQQTQREEDRAVMGAIAEAAPQLVPVFADLWVGSQQSRAARLIAERLKKINPAAKDEEEEGTLQIPPQVAQQLQQLQQAHQEAMQVVQQLQEQIKTDQAKQQASIQNKQAEIAGQAQRQQADLAGQMQLKMLDVQAQERIERAKFNIEVQLRRAELNEEETIKILDREAARAEEEATRAQQRADEQATRAHERAMAILEASLEQKADEQRILAERRQAMLDAELAIKVEEAKATAARKLAILQADLAPEPTVTSGGE